MRLRYSNDTTVMRDDDSGAGNNAQLLCFATQSGLHYLSVGSGGNGTGSYTLSATALSTDWTRLVNIPENIKKQMPSNWRTMGASYGD